MEHITFDQNLTKPDLLVLQSLAADLGQSSDSLSENLRNIDNGNDELVITRLTARNDPNHEAFEPTVFTGIDLDQLSLWLPAVVDRWILRPYVRMAQSVVRVETDVVLLTHLLVYLTTSVLSAALLFRHFSWLHAIPHLVMQVTFMGPYTLMMHQHIHMRGFLAPRFALLDYLFPYLTDPLMGHTWNTYYYHHVKHHHAEANGPSDLSSTIRYQRDSKLDFARYVARFLCLIWLDLPLYFFRRRRLALAAKCAFWELTNYTAMYACYRLNPRPTVFVLLLPFLILRIALMVGNWGQHAFVDADDPDSNYRSSITLIDVASNRYSFNDGYHTSHHLNPLRHWREHPVSFMESRHVYASQGALVFHNIDYFMITVRLLMKDYDRLARCMVPIGEQVGLDLQGRIGLLKKCTRRFSEEIGQKFKKTM